MFSETSSNKKNKKIKFGSSIWLKFIYSSMCRILLTSTSTQLWTQVIYTATPRLLSIILRIAMFTYSNLLSCSFIRAWQA